MGGIFRRFWPHMVCAVVALGLWDTPVVKPFRVFMVMIHEMCHAGATLLTGGEVVEMRTNWNESGHTLSRGGYPTVISSAGYVGSAFLGAFMIYAGNWAVVQRVLLAGVGCFSLGMTILYTPVMGIDFAFGVLSGVFLAVVALRFPRVTEVVATWLGVLLCLYSLYDFRTDLWMYPTRTDAGILARYWGLPVLAYPIAFFWAAISVFAMYLAMRAVDRRGRRIEAQREKDRGDAEVAEN